MTRRTTSTSSRSRSHRTTDGRWVSTRASGRRSPTVQTRPLSSARRSSRSTTWKTLSTSPSPSWPPRTSTPSAMFRYIDLFSFNKEQAEGDLQNIVFCVMAERICGLQDAVDTVTEMTVTRVADYLRLKAALPSFGAAVDAEVARYLKGLEYFAQGANVWHYHSPRYFADASAALGVPEVVLPVYQRSRCLLRNR
ncbi:isoprenoid synthase domain-containing protein [Earliella scabrosa]|nr:isoprenoid synthase domain-containing protein [Earliella scabrosa]